MNAALTAFTQSIDSPYFVYDLDALSAHIQSLQDWPVTLWYALKANPLSHIIKTVYQAGMRVDVASIGELDQVLRAGVDPKDILHTGPGKSKAQLAYFLEQGVRTFVCESVQQLADLNGLLEGDCHAVPAHNDAPSDSSFRGQRPWESQDKVSVLLRVQLSWEKSDSNVLGGCGLTPFGLDPDSWAEANVAQYQNVDIMGLHCFQWGNMLCAEELTSIWEEITRQLVALAEQMGIELRVIDLGGGLGIPYDDSAPLSIEDVKQALTTLTEAHPYIQYWMELGRYAVGPFGQYLCQVIDVKAVRHAEVKGREHPMLAVLNGGSHHLMRPAITGQAFPVSCLRASSAPTSEFQVHGPLCTGIDQLATAALPSDLAAGDWLVFAQTGAYGFTESMPWFLCHTLPGEAVIESGQLKIVREAQGAESWLV